MIERSRLRDFHNQDLPLHILEQDYIQALFLMEIYSRVDSLVFKGGTYLKHAYGLDRYSEDLDFTLNREEKIQEKLEEAADELSYYGVPSEIQNTNETDTSINLKLVYRGPLYDGTERSKGRIEIEISKRSDVFLTPEWKRLFFDYPETGTVVCLGLHIEEVLAEKLRALSSRNRARDLYDVWYLLNKDIEIDFELFKKKMDVIDEEPKIDITVTEQTWKKELEILVEHPPEFQDVYNYVDRAIKNGFSGKNTD